MEVLRTRVKFCGLVRPQDVDTAVALGVDAVGFVFYPKSARCVTLDEGAVLRRRLPSWVRAVGLFVNEPLRLTETRRHRHWPDWASRVSVTGRRYALAGRWRMNSGPRGFRQGGCRRMRRRWARHWVCSGRRSAVCWTAPVRALAVRDMRSTGRCWRIARTPGRPVLISRAWCWPVGCSPRRWARRSVGWLLLRWMCPAGFKGAIQGRKTRLEWSVS